MVPDEYIEEVKVSLELRNITLYDAIRYLVEVSHLDVCVDEEEYWDEDEEEDWEGEDEED